MNKLLIIDDDPEIMDWLSMDLQMSGFSTDSATDGLNGLQKSTEWQL